MERETVKIELLRRKVGHGKAFAKGEILTATIYEDGSAKPKRAPMMKLNSNEYQLYIPDQEFDKLLEQGDVV